MVNAIWKKNKDLKYKREYKMEINLNNISEYFQYNAKITLSMFFISLVVLFLNYITKGKSDDYLFSVERDSWLKPRTYIRLFTHILGHQDWNHFSNNYLKILILGPLIEEKYGSMNLLIMILITALVTGIITHIRGKVRAKGASGIVFMLIVLSAFVNVADNKIPLTFVLIILFYVVDEIMSIRKKDNIGHYAHVYGAICGAIFGFICIHQNLSEILLSWIK